MLPQPERLKTNQNIERVLFKGKRTKSDFFKIYFFLNQQNPRIFRGAIIAGKKVSLKAVLRNKAKRVFTAALREVRQDQTMYGDFVFILDKKIVGIEFQVIKKELQKCLSDLLLLPSNSTKRHSPQTTV